jgi:hypothetical protein
VTKKEIKRDAKATLRVVKGCEVELTRCLKKVWRATFIGRAAKAKDIRRLMDVRDELSALRARAEERVKL